MLIDKPREIILNTISFSKDEVKVLKNIFSTMDMAKISHTDIRKTAELGKALRAGAVANLKVVPEGELVELNLTQAGRSLLGKV